MYFFILAALAFLAGIVCNWMIRESMNVLCQNAGQIEHTGNTFFKQMKLKYENCIKMGHEINNTEAFAGKYLEKYKWHGIYIRSLEKFSAYSAGLCVVFAVCGALLERERVMEYLLIGFLAMYIVAGSRKIIDVPAKKQKVTTDIVDYFENRYFAVTNEQTEKDNNSGAEVKTLSKAPQNEFSAEEKKLIDEILREYLG